LGTDDVAQHMLRREGSHELSIPLQLGAHTTHVQTTREVGMRAPLGFVTIDAPLPFAASSSTMSVGLPQGTTALALFGGDAPWIALAWKDALCIAIALLVSMIALRGWKSRALGTVALGGIWFLYAPAFVAITIGLALFGVAALASRVLKGRVRTAVLVAFGFAVLGALGVFGMSAKMHASEQSYAFASSEDRAMYTMTDQLAGRPMVTGVSPVALRMPAAASSVTASRTIVTPSHPMKVTLVYANASIGWLAFCAWIATWILLARRNKDAIEALRTKIRSLQAPAPQAA
jgi:hypothetical protein